ncbi:MAG: PAS domain-containing protein [Thermonemataceae bacterium]|nr:PAS domain-containing protein [Thermonemataceae bacterium]
MSHIAASVQSFYEHIYQPVFIYDENKMVIYANSSMLQLLNTSSVEIKKKSLSDLIGTYPNMQQEVEKKVMLTKADGSKTMATMNEVPLDTESKQVAVLLNPMEVGNSNNAEEKIRLLLKTIHKDIAIREEELEKVSNELDARTKILNATAIVSETDKYGTITFVNETFCRVAKYTPEELLGKPHNIVRHPDMPKEAFKQMWETIQSGGIFRGIVKNRAKDGSPYWVIATIAPVLGTDGKPYKYIGVRIDITELVKRGAKIDVE